MRRVVFGGVAFVAVLVAGLFLGREAPSSEWAWKPFQLAEAGGPGPYRPGSGVYERPFDDSDPEMKALLRATT